MTAEALEIIVALRRRLHRCPELSGQEARTMRTLWDFLEAHTALELTDMGGWLLAAHREGDGLPTLAFRADMDAIPAGGGRARHGCGHDGHCAILCALALMMEGRRFGANVCLIFQGSEENGEGARRVIKDWPALLKADRIYALHNIPGHKAGTLLVRPGCFACASRGFVVAVTGRPAHAAYPEEGANPAALLCRLALAVPGMIGDILQDDGRLLNCTVVGLHVGGEDFGMSAAEGRLCLTLRGYRAEDIDALAERIEDFAMAGCAEAGMRCRFEARDEFPDTTNPAGIVEACADAWRAAGFQVKTLAEPMRWSEDFGWYLRAVPGMYFGVGIGEDHPGLHTAKYEFDDAIIGTAAEALLALVRAGVSRHS